MYPFYPQYAPDQALDTVSINVVHLLVALLVVGGLMAGVLLIAYWREHRQEHRHGKPHTH
jgi:hypothetical protein